MRESLQANEAAAQAFLSRWALEQLPEVAAKRLDVFAPSLLKIRTKKGGQLWSFMLNPIQADYLEGLRTHHCKHPEVDNFRGIRDLIVKPRQLGFSTFIAALYFMDGFFNPGRITVVLSHDLGISQELLRTYKTFWEKMPPELKEGLTVKSSSKYELELHFPMADVPPSRWIIDTEAGNEWRGGVIHNLHASEAAHYGDWDTFMASYVQAVPEDGNIAFETTTNGRNHFWAETMTALEQAGRPGARRVVFYAWFMHPEYVRTWDPEVQPPLTKEEADLMAAHGLSLEQIAWRRNKQSELRGLFLQEYPETLEGAFIASGNAFLDLKAVDRGAQVAKLAAEPRSPMEGVRIWEEPIPGEDYLLILDPAEGINRGEEQDGGERGGTDFSSGTMIHARTLRVVAAIHGRIPPVEFARIGAGLGRLYNACIAVERNNHGHTVIAALQGGGYPWVYRHVEYDASGSQRFLVAGFPTNAVTRPLVLDALYDAVRSGALYSPDTRFWRQGGTFIRNERGKPEAAPGFHDDVVITHAIGTYLCGMGRSAWGVDGAAGADEAGIPLGAVPAMAPLVPGPVVAPPQPPVQLPEAESAPPPAPGTSRVGFAGEGVLPGSLPPTTLAGAQFYSDGQVQAISAIETAQQEVVLARAQTCRGCMFAMAAPTGQGHSCRMHRFGIRLDDPGCPQWSPLEDDTPPDPSWGMGWGHSLR